MNYRNGIPDGAVYYNQPGTVAVIFDPEGGHHMCNELGNVHPAAARFWCAGMVGPSPSDLADRLHAAWFRTDHPCPDETYARLERSFGERE
jgi:hypothetical protein